MLTGCRYDRNKGRGRKGLAVYVELLRRLKEVYRHFCKGNLQSSVRRDQQELIRHLSSASYRLL